MNWCDALSRFVADIKTVTVVNLHISFNIIKNRKFTKQNKKLNITKTYMKYFEKIPQNSCKSGSFLMIADPQWFCIMLLCGPLWVLCGI